MGIGHECRLLVVVVVVVVAQCSVLVGEFARGWFLIAVRGVVDICCFLFFTVVIYFIPLPGEGGLVALHSVLHSLGAFFPEHSHEERFLQIPLSGWRLRW